VNCPHHSCCPGDGCVSSPSCSCLWLLFILQGLVICHLYIEAVLAKVLQKNRTGRETERFKGSYHCGVASQSLCHSLESKGWKPRWNLCSAIWKQNFFFFEGLPSFPLRPSPDCLRPTHIEEDQLLGSESTDSVLLLSKGDFTATTTSAWGLTKLSTIT
jgi:hypothetical protein